MGSGSAIVNLARRRPTIGGPAAVTANSTAGRFPASGRMPRRP